MKLHIKGGWLYGYVRLVGANGEVLMHSENYYSMSNAKRAAKRLSKLLHIPIK